MPRNLAQVTERLPASQYQPEPGKGMNRNSSLPSIREETKQTARREELALPVPGSSESKARGKSLATIEERYEAIRSADPNVSASRKMAAADAARKLAPTGSRPSNYNGGRQ